MMRMQMALLCLVILQVPVTARADWIYDMTSEACSDASRQQIANGVRTRLEDSVRRAEASIAPPEPVGELACLESLMTLDIGNFAPTGGIRNLFNQSLAQLFDNNGQLARRLCRVAARKWQDVTKSLAVTGYQPGTVSLPSYLSSGPFQPVAPSSRQATSGLINPITGVRVPPGSDDPIPDYANPPDALRAADVNQQNSQSLTPTTDPSSTAGTRESGNKLVDGIWGSLYQRGGTP